MGGGKNEFKRIDWVAFPDELWIPTSSILHPGQNIEYTPGYHWGERLLLRCYQHQDGETGRMLHLPDLCLISQRLCNIGQPMLSDTAS